MNSRTSNYSQFQKGKEGKLIKQRQSGMKRIRSEELPKVTGERK